MRPAEPRVKTMWKRNLLFVAVVLAGGALLAGVLSPDRVLGPRTAARSTAGVPTSLQRDAHATLERIDATLAQMWASAGLAAPLVGKRIESEVAGRLGSEGKSTGGAPAALEADWRTLARRLSLALTGAIPSLEELRWLETLPADERFARHFEHLFADRRTADYLAERFARAFVGTQDGPFVIYRRRRFVSWLADAFHARRPYDQMVRDMIAADGLWTDHPATNFITVTARPDAGEGPDETDLAARVSRAMLGLRIDCAECHDHPFEPWTQTNFHGLAAFFGPTEQGLTGIHDGGAPYEMEDLRSSQRRFVAAGVPFAAELLPTDGDLRERLARWVTHPKNEQFARATANRVWALVFGRPLVEPVDDLRSGEMKSPLLEILASDFSAHGFQLERLFWLAASNRAFRLDSRLPSTIPDAESPRFEAAWAVFPLTRLRPEQVASAVLQSSSLKTLDYESHILFRIARAAQQADFLQRYGDVGEDELAPQPGTIPQRLLLMNGDLVQDQIKEDLVTNAATQIAQFAPDDAQAVRTAYLSTLARLPAADEQSHFEARLAGSAGAERTARVEDLFWSLLNSTEFAWNH